MGTRRALAAAASVLALAAAPGCGGDDGSDAGSGSGGGSGPVSASRAVDEAFETKTGLDRALERYREGDRGAAADELASAREDHYGAVDRALRDAASPDAAALRAQIATALPRAIDEGVTVTDLARRIAAFEAALDRATAKLRAP